MISGLFNPGIDRPANICLLNPVHYGGKTVSRDLLFPGFCGQYLLNPDLPYTHKDLYYQDDANGTVVLLSGSLFNKAELISGLPGLNRELHTPELVSHLFLKHGPGFVRELNGDFVIFILKPAEKEAYLFRDHVGIHPLGYCLRNGAIYFSTDISGLCRVMADGLPADHQYLSGYFRYIDYRTTPYGEVRKLLPGHYLHFSEAGTVVTKYWWPETVRVNKELTYERMMADLKELLNVAVSIRCDRRFKAGAHVTGGIDSAVVSVLARKEYAGQEEFYGFSWSPADYSPSSVVCDERELVLRLCNENQIIAQFSDLDTKNFPGTVSSFYDNNGFFSEERTLRQASEAGVNMIFSGWGGDEFISTSAPAIEADLLRDLKFGLYLRRNEFNRPKRFIRNVWLYLLMPALRIHDRATARSFRDDSHYLKKPFKKSLRRAVRQFYFNTSRRAHHLGMLDFYHLQDRCEKWYVMGYRNGVEYRYPLLDRRIIEYVLGIPSELLCTTGISRPVLRELGKGMLPEEIRMNMSKTDPVYWDYMDRLYESAADSFAPETGEWRKNPALSFIDFMMLERDIQKSESTLTAREKERLRKAIVWIKGLHEFSLEYSINSAS